MEPAFGPVCNLTILILALKFSFHLDGVCAYEMKKTEEQTKQQINMLKYGI